MGNASQHDGSQGITRRQVLRTGAGLTAAATTVGLPLLAATPASATVASSSYFYLGGKGDDPVLRQTLHQPYWAMQSFAYDYINKNIYIAQVKPYSKTGDNWINKTDVSGNVLGTMAIHGFGHASSMGVEPTSAGAEPYLWLEGAVNTASGGGQRIARFRYVEGGDLTWGASSINDRTPTISRFVNYPRPAIDPYTNRLLIRYRANLTDTRPWRIALFNLDDAVAGRLTDDDLLLDRAIPNNTELGPITNDDDFQGITAYGQYAYLSYGAPPTDDVPEPKSYLVRLNMNETGASYDEVFRTTAGASLPGREPQGIAVWRTSSGPRLSFGFSSKISTGPDEFQATIFDKYEVID